jgi:uncharacterized protein YcaQ
MTRSLSAAQARRIAIHAQGLADARPAAPGRGHSRKLARKLGVIQIDSVNVLARAHYLPLAARLGAYRQADLDAEAWGKKPSLFEYWAHAAAFVPMEMHPLFRFRMAHYAQRKSAMWGYVPDGYPQQIRRVLDEIRDKGPLTGGHFAEEKRQAGWWNWSEGKRALEWLFAAGELSIAPRRGFERTYDLTERVIPPEVLNAPTPTEEEAVRALTLFAARAVGVGTLADINDYFRIRLQKHTKAALDDLVSAGELEKVTVKAWGEPAYLLPGTKVPRTGARGALLSPFDNMVFRRERVERMFGLRYRIGIYTPADQRTHGYYVLMFLRGDAIAAQVDLKSERKAGILRVQAAHLEAGQEEAETAAALAEELRMLARFLGLADIAVTKKGDLSAALGRLFD